MGTSVASPAVSGQVVNTRSEPPERRPLLIGDLAIAASVSPDTLRHYERRGLLLPSGRRPSGYREYPTESVAVVRFIQHAQALGFTLAEVDELLQRRGGIGQPGAALSVRAVAVAKLQDIDEKLQQLETLRGALADLVAECEQACGDGRTLSDSRDCPILSAQDSRSDPRL